MDLIQRLENGIVLCAEGYVVELERRGLLQAGIFAPVVVLQRPDSVKELYREFLEAGSDVIVALTYYAHREKLKLIGLQGKTEELNRKAIRLAKEVAEEGHKLHSTTSLIAGNICNTGIYDPKNPKETSEKVRLIYEEQVRWAKEEGVDFIIAETIEFLGEALVALKVIKDHNLHAVVTLFPSLDSTYDGYSFHEACHILEENGADVVGLNCSRGPATMFPLLKDIRKSVKGYVAALPVPFLTTVNQPTIQKLKLENGKQAFPTRLDSFTLDRDIMADFAVNAKKLGINYIGICCGAGPHHVRAMAEALGRKPPASIFSPDMSKHITLGSEKNTPGHRRLLKKQVY